MTKQNAKTKFWDALSNFEKWQVILAIFQTAVLIVTSIAAVYIGLQQNSINQKLYDLNFKVSLEIGYENKRLNIYNKGKENIWIWGN